MAFNLIVLLPYFFQTCGFVQVVCGFLLLCDTQRILLSRLLAAPDGGLMQPPFYYMALALLAGGMIVCATAALGCWATYMPGYIILTFVSVCYLHYLFRTKLRGVKSLWTSSS